MQTSNNTASANFCTPAAGHIAIVEKSPGVVQLLRGLWHVPPDQENARCLIEYSQAANVVLDCLQQSLAAHRMACGAFRVSFEKARQALRDFDLETGELLRTDPWQRGQVVGVWARPGFYRIEAFYQNGRQRCAAVRLLFPAQRPNAAEHCELVGLRWLRAVELRVDPGKDAGGVAVKVAA